jgi:hypothetical protein
LRLSSLCGRCGKIAIRIPAGRQRERGEKGRAAMKKKLSIGIEDFREMICNGYYYVDKTLLIKEILDTLGKANLFFEIKAAPTQTESSAIYVVENPRKTCYTFFTRAWRNTDDQGCSSE